MTPEETKEYIHQRLHELGLQVQLDRAGYDKIYRFTNGTESGANKICFKLISLCSEDDARAVSGDVLTTAIDDLVRVEDLIKRPARSVSRKQNDEADRVSIEKLAAVLEANADSADAMPEPRPAPPPRVAAPPGARTAARARPGGNGAHRPKVVVVNESQTRRAIVVNVLAKNFTCMECSDAERAWRMLNEQRDIDMVITDLQGHNRNGYELIARLRSSAAPSHLSGIPIIAVATTDDANAKRRALAAGANDVIPLNIDAGELEARVNVRYKSLQAQRLPASAEAKAARGKPAPARIVAGAAAPSHRSLPPVAPPAAARRPIDPLHVDTTARPFMARADSGHAAGPPSLLRQLHQISSTTTITLSATVLVIVALTVILYANRMETEVAHEVASAPAPNLAGSDAPAAPGAGAKEETAAADTPPPAVPPIEPSPPIVKTDPAATVNTRNAEAKSKEGDSVPPGDTSAAGMQGARPDAAEPQRPPPPPPTAKLEARSRPDEPATQPASPPAIAPPPAVGPQDRTMPAQPETGSLPAPQADVEFSPPTAAVAPPARTAPDRLNQEDLAELLQRLVFVYEAGDIEQFMNLFAPNARTNDRATRNGIREDYESLFRTTDVRFMKLSHVKWEVENNRAQGWGNFEVSVRRAGERESYDYQGSITLYVERIDGRLRIVRMYHGQRRAGS